MYGIFFPLFLKDEINSSLHDVRVVAWGFNLVSLNLPKVYHMSSGLSIHCARDVYCYPFCASLGQCLVLYRLLFHQGGDSGSRGDFWQLQSEAAGRLHCWSRQVLDGLASGHFLPAGRCKLLPSAEDTSLWFKNKERIFLWNWVLNRNLTFSEDGESNQVKPTHSSELCCHSCGPHVRAHINYWNGNGGDRGIRFDFKYFVGASHMLLHLWLLMK